MADEKDWKSILNRKVTPLISTKQLYVNNRWYQLWPKIKRLDPKDVSHALREFLFILYNFFTTNDPQVNKKIDKALKDAIQKHIVDNPEVWPVENVQKRLFMPKEYLVEDIDQRLLLNQRMSMQLRWIQDSINPNYPQAQQFFDQIYEKMYYTFADQFLVTLSDAEAGFIVQKLNLLVGPEVKATAMTEVEKLKQQIADAKSREPFIKITTATEQLDREFLWHEFFAKLMRLELKNDPNTSASRAIIELEAADKYALEMEVRLSDMQREEFLLSRHSKNQDALKNRFYMDDAKNVVTNAIERRRIAKVHAATVINSDINNTMFVAMKRVVGWIQNLKPYDEKFHQLVQQSLDERIDRARHLKENHVSERTDPNFTKLTQRMYGQVEQDWISTFLNKFSESQIKAVIKQAMDYYHRNDFAYFAANVVQPFYDIPATAIAALTAIPNAVAPIMVDVKNADAKSVAERKNPGSAYDAVTGRPIRPVGLRQPVNTREVTAVSGLNLTGGRNICTCRRYK